MLHHSLDDYVVRYNGCCRLSNISTTTSATATATATTNANTTTIQSTVIPEGGECCCGISERRGALPCVSAPDVTTAWLQHNGCSPFSEMRNSYQLTRPGYTVNCRTGVGCKHNTTLCTYGNARHVHFKLDIWDTYAASFEFLSTHFALPLAALSSGIATSADVAEIATTTSVVTWLSVFSLLGLLVFGTVRRLSSQRHRSKR
jgi:hypothetical protein